LKLKRELNFIKFSEASGLLALLPRMDVANLWLFAAPGSNQARQRAMVILFGKKYLLSIQSAQISDRYMFVCGVNNLRVESKGNVVSKVERSTLIM
jgi:hypothetical protein